MYRPILHVICDSYEHVHYLSANLSKDRRFAKIYGQSIFIYNKNGKSSKSIFLQNIDTEPCAVNYSPTMTAEYSPGDTIVLIHDLASAGTLYSDSLNHIKGFISKYLDENSVNYIVNFGWIVQNTNHPPETAKTHICQNFNMILPDKWQYITYTIDESKYYSEYLGNIFNTNVPVTSTMSEQFEVDAEAAIIQVGDMVRHRIPDLSEITISEYLMTNFMHYIKSECNYDIKIYPSIKSYTPLTDDFDLDYINMESSAKIARFYIAHLIDRNGIY